MMKAETEQSRRSQNVKAKDAQWKGGVKGGLDRTNKDFSSIFFSRGESGADRNQ